jgi:hypothetical protein
MLLTIRRVRYIDGRGRAANRLAAYTDAGVQVGLLTPHDDTVLRAGAQIYLSLVVAADGNLRALWAENNRHET